MPTRADHDRYYTLPVEIPQTGVYLFKMKCVEWNNWNPQANENSQMPDKSAIRVSFTDAPGYEYTQIQSHVFDMNTDNRGAVDDSKKTSIEWIDCEGRFFLTAGTHYLSFAGSHALYPVRDLSLVLDETAAMTELPASDGISVTVNMEDDAPVGGWLMTNDPGVEAEYVFVPDNDTDRIRTYGPWRERFITQEGTLYAYEIKDGVHCALLQQHAIINAPVYKDEYITITGLSPEDAGTTPKAIFSHPEYMGVYYYFRPQGLEYANVEYDEEGRDGYTLVKEPEMEFNENGTLTLYPYIYGVEGAMRIFEINFKKSAIEAIGKSAADGMIYDLQGRRLDTEPIRGIFIRAGRVILK